MIRPLNAKLLRAPFLTRTSVSRSFNQYRPFFPNTNRLHSTITIDANSNNKKEEENQAPSSLSDYVQKFGGWYPLIGLGGFIAVSKEILVLNPELLMVTNFAAVLAISWFVAGDAVTKMVEDERAATKKKSDDIMDLYIETIEAEISAFELHQNIAPLLQSLKAEYSSLSSQVVKAKELQSRQVARDAAVARLNAIYQREQAEKAKKLSGILNATYSKVLADLEKLTDKERGQIIDYAIDVIAGKKTTLDDQVDPVKRAYKKYLGK